MNAYEKTAAVIALRYLSKAARTTIDLMNSGMLNAAMSGIEPHASQFVRALDALEEETAKAERVLLEGE